MKRYVGQRQQGQTVVFIEQDGYHRVLLPIMRRGATRLEWGYGGLDSAALALSILADALGESRRLRADPSRIEGSEAARLHQAFLFDVIVRLPYQGFSLPAADVEAWLWPRSARFRQLQARPKRVWQA